MLHKASTCMKNEYNVTVYNRLYNESWKRKEGRCPICPAHGGENAPKRVPWRSWKFKRKTKYRDMVDMSE